MRKLITTCLVAFAASSAWAGRTLANLRSQASAAVAKGQDLEAFKNAIDTSAFEKDFTSDDATRKLLFKAWWIEPISRSLWYEANGKPILQDDVNSN